MGGGFTDGRFTATMERLDITKPDAQWTTCAPMSVARVFLGAASVKGFLYALGGRNATGAEIKTVERYDPATDAWIVCTPMRTAVEDYAAVALNDHIYVLGGVVTRGRRIMRVADVNRYDPVTDTWTTCAPMRNERQAIAAAVINGSIIVAGGFIDGSEPLATVERYDAATNTWSACAPMPTARGNVAGCAVGTSFYVLGGTETIGNTVMLATVERYDADADRWEACPPMPTGRCFFGSTAW